MKIGRFVGWLIGTQQLVPTADYVVARRPLLGRVVARCHAEFFENFLVTAAAVGFSVKATRLQWTALVQACAVSGRRPQDLSHDDLDRSRAELCAAAERLGKGSRRSLRTAMFGLEATLFHAGVTDELPRNASWTRLRSEPPSGLRSGRLLPHWRRR